MMRCARTAPCFRVDAEIRLQRNVDLHPRGYVDEASAAPNRAVERRELVVAVRDDRAEILAHDVRVLAQAGIHVEKDHALALKVLADAVIHDFGVVLGAHAGQELALGFGNAQAVERVLDVVRNVFPVARLTILRPDVVVDVVEVDARQIGAPGRHRLALELLQRLQPELEHPLGLVLLSGDLAHHVGAQAPRRLVDRFDVVVEPELIGIESEVGRFHRHALMPPVSRSGPRSRSCRAPAPVACRPCGRCDRR